MKIYEAKDLPDLKNPLKSVSLSRSNIFEDPNLPFFELIDKSGTAAEDRYVKLRLWTYFRSKERSVSSLSETTTKILGKGY
jgi:hypothetical protein